MAARQLFYGGSDLSGVYLKWLYMWNVILQTVGGIVGKRERQGETESSGVFFKGSCHQGELVCCSVTDVCLNKDE